MNKCQLFATRSLAAHSFEFRYSEKTADGTRFVAPATVMEPYAPGAPCEPTFTLDEGEAQALMDELYRLGLRPTGIEATAADTLDQARKDHIGDLRRAAFGD